MGGQTQQLLSTTLESIKSQRDLYLATRDLFVRHDRLSLDQVDRLKKRIDTTSVKLEGVRSAKKDGWEEEADRLGSAIEKDKAMIQSMLNRRVFVRAWCVSILNVMPTMMEDADWWVVVCGTN